MLKIKNLRVEVEGKEILKGLDLSVENGEIHAIMGPNGSGKSTLAYTLAGHPKYELKSGKMELDGADISEMAPNERAEKGLFLAMQYPVAIPGLTVQSFLWQIYKKRNLKLETGNENKIEKKSPSLIEFRKWLVIQAESLGLDTELLKRGLNDGFSGGEKKKLEILQLLVFGPKYIILDEIDSGLDVDALKKIAKTVEKVARANKIGVIAITHYSRILEFLKPDKVHMVKDGQIVESGGDELTERIEKGGYGMEEVND